MEKKLLGLLLVLVISFSLLLGCTEDNTIPINPTNETTNPSNGITNGVTNTNSNGAVANVPNEPSADSLTQSKNLIASASTALLSGNKTDFVKLLSSPMQSQIGTAEMDTAEATKLASAISNATIVKQTENIIVYETTIDGEKINFYTIKEGDKWVIEGL